MYSPVYHASASEKGYLKAVGIYSKCLLKLLMMNYSVGSLWLASLERSDIKQKSMNSWMTQTGNISKLDKRTHILLTPWRSEMKHLCVGKRNTALVSFLWGTESSTKAVHQQNRLEYLHGLRPLSIIELLLRERETGMKTTHHLDESLAVLVWEFFYWTHLHSVLSKTQKHIKKGCEDRKEKYIGFQYLIRAAKTFRIWQVVNDHGLRYKLISCHTSGYS